MELAILIVKSQEYVIDAFTGIQVGNKDARTGICVENRFTRTGICAILHLKGGCFL